MRTKKPLDDRLLDNVVRSKSGCWEWALSTNKKGYGKFSVKHQTHEGAHRVSYRVFCAQIPPGLFVLHHCDNPACIRPDHLFLGTNDDNVRDMIAKGRQNKGRTCPPEKTCRGEDSFNAKLTSQAVLDIRKRVAAGEKQCRLADEYNVSRATICLVVKRSVWAHVVADAVPGTMIVLTDL